MRHTIKKQIFDLWIDKRLDAFVLQQQVSDRFWTDLLPEMEKIFNELSDNDQTIKIDVLEIDLGSITPEMIDSGEWMHLLKKELEIKLQKAFSVIGLREGGSRAASSENSFNQWYYLMEHGCLPWNAGRPSEEWFLQVLEAIAANYAIAQQLRTMILRQPQALKRIISHHSSDFLSHLAELLTAEKQQELPAAINELARWLMAVSGTRAKEAMGQTEKDAVQRIWSAVLQKVAIAQPQLHTAALVEYLLTGWLQLAPEELSALVTMHPLKEGPGFIQPIITALTRDVVKKQNGSKPIPETEKPDPSLTKQDHISSKQETEKIIYKKENNKNIDDPGSVHEKVLTTIKKEETPVEDHHDPDPGAIAEEGIYIVHAGLVLLHPFLHTFFKKLGLTEQGKFIDTTRQERAICLLHELADRDTPFYEYELVLPKLLCNWPLHKPVNTAIDLTEEEKEEAQKLLEAAIAQWEILKTTSPAGLQQTFLQRDGKLFYKNENWYLQVEKTSMDILLSHLPWTIGMIKLPWMKHLLRVEWI
jgi:hypothetical protein